MARDGLMVGLWDILSNTPKFCCNCFLPASHGGFCSSVLDTNPCGLGGGVRVGGGGLKIFLHF